MCAPVAAQVQLDPIADLSEHLTHYTAATKPLATQMSRSLSLSQYKLKECATHTRKCSAADVDRLFAQNEKPKFLFLGLACGNWATNSFTDSRASLGGWQNGPLGSCRQIGRTLKDYLDWLPQRSQAAAFLREYRIKANQPREEALVARFQNTLIELYQEEHRSAVYSSTTTESFSYHTGEKLGVFYRADRGNIVAINRYVEGRTGSDAVRTTEAQQAAAERREAQKKPAGEAFRDGLYDAMRALGFPHPDDPKGPKPLLIEGRATFNGIVFEQDVAREIVPAFAKRLEQNAQFALGSPTGIKNTWKSKSRDGKVTYHCWEYYPKYRATPTRTTCLYESGGKIVGGRFDSNEFDQPLIRYLGQQGFELTRSLGAKQLGFAARNDFYSMSNGMRVGYQRMGVRYNRDKVFYESDFCFYPARLAASIDAVLKCDLTAR